MHLPKIDVTKMAILEKDPAKEWFVYQVREQRGGKGSSSKLDSKHGRDHIPAKGGFFLVPEKSKTIIEMFNDPRLRPYALGVLGRLNTIMASYRKEIDTLYEKTELRKVGLK